MKKSKFYRKWYHTRAKNVTVESLEEMVAALQGDVDAINNLLESGKVIQSITPNEDGTEYTITYVGDNIQADVINAQLAAHLCGIFPVIGSPTPAVVFFGAMQLHGHTCYVISHLQQHHR